MQKVILSLAVLNLMACSTIEEVTGHAPIIDMQGVNVARYENDLAACKTYADDVQLGRQTASAAAAGAVVGGAIGAVVGNSNTAQRGAGVGAVAGGSRGLSGALSERTRVIRNCLRGRGYRVLN